MMLRVATWNIHAALGRDGRHDPGRIWALIEAIDCSVLGLQEVEIRHPVTDLLLDRARAAGYATHFAPTRPATRGMGQFGNLLLSRLPLRPLPTVDLSVPGREPRNLLRAEVTYAGRQIALWVTHLGLRARERRLQVRRIHEYRLAEQPQGTPECVLLGDFNEWMPGQRNLRLIHQHFLRLPAPRSFPAHRPLFALDAIWLAGDLHPVDVHGARHPLRAVASDHLPIIGQIRPGPSFESDSGV